MGAARYVRKCENMLIIESELLQVNAVAGFMGFGVGVGRVLEVI